MSAPTPGRLKRSLSLTSPGAVLRHKKKNNGGAIPFEVPDPSLHPSREGIPEDRWRAGNDPDRLLGGLDPKTLFETWEKRAAIFYGGGKHPLTEVLVHLVFPRREEMPLAYMALWYRRDHLTFAEIARRVKTNEKIVARYCRAIDKRLSDFVQRNKLNEKILQGTEVLEPAQELEVTVREILGGED